MAIKLDELVREYLIEAGDTSEHRYARLLTIAINGLKEMNMDVSGVPKTVALEISDIDTANLPEDYISYTRIGICKDDGNIHTLGWNPNMCTPRDYDDCGDLETDNTSTDALTDSTAPLFIPVEGGLVRNGESIGRIYGLGGGNNMNGYYNIDENRKVIAFQSLLSTDVWLDYLADISLVDGNYYVHAYDEEAVKAWMYWKDIQRNRTYGDGSKNEAKREYIRNKNLSRRRHQSFTIEEAKQTIRRNNKQSVKF